MLTVELSGTVGEQLRLLVQVGDATPESKRHWLIRCVFARPLSEEVLQDLLEE